jgi:hypothetical protein
MLVCMAILSGLYPYYLATVQMHEQYRGAVAATGGVFGALFLAYARAMAEKPKTV